MRSDFAALKSLPRPDIRVGVVLGTSVTVDAAETAAQAETVGLDSVWIYEDLQHAGAFSTAGAVVGRTRTIRIGVGVISPYTRHPVVCAMEAGNLHAISGGRFTLGIGTSPAITLARLGIEQKDPIGTMNETVRLLRSVFAGGQEFDGAVLHVHDAPLAFPVKGSGPPIFVAAIGDRMLDLAGSVADGVVFSLMAPPSFIGRALKRVHASGARKARPPIESVVYVHFAYSNERAEARSRIRETLARHISRFVARPDLARLVTRDGLLLTEQISDIAARYSRHEDPRRFISDDLVDSLSIAGDRDDLVRGLQSYHDAGVREVALWIERSDRADREITGALRTQPSYEGAERSHG